MTDWKFYVIGSFVDRQISYDNRVVYRYNDMSDIIYDFDYGDLQYFDQIKVFDNKFDLVANYESKIKR